MTRDNGNLVDAGLHTSELFVTVPEISTRLREPPYVS